MRLWTVVGLAALAGCAVPELPELPEAPPEAPRVAASASALELPECARLFSTFDARVTLQGLDDQAGVTELVLHAKQYGKLAIRDVPVEPHRATEVVVPVSIDSVGTWQVYVMTPASDVPPERIRIAHSRCGGDVTSASSP